MRPSPHQQAILDWVADPNGTDAVVRAVAGSGKTTTLVMVANAIPDRGCFLAFGKAIQQELEQRLPRPRWEARTIHSQAMQACKKALGQGLVPDTSKYPTLLRGLLREEGIGPHTEAGAGIFAVARSLVDHARLALAEPTYEGLEELVEHLSLEVPEGKGDLVFNLVEEVLTRGREAIWAQRSLDFTDMIWVVAKGLVTPSWQHQWLLVDECQDLSPAQLEVVLRLRRAGGRILFVGDPRQAIFGFAGADTRSVDRIIERTGAITLPLSVCYRCPTKVVDLARRIVPEIQAAPSAAEGEVDGASYDELVEGAGAGDLIICRTIRPLVSAALDLAKAGRPVNLRGPSLEAELLPVLDRAAKALGTHAASVPAALAGWASNVAAELDAKPSGAMAAEMLRERVEALLLVADAARPRSWEAWAKAVKDLSSTSPEAVQLSTIHRAKGLEAPRVWLLGPELLPHPKATKPWELEQETNLRYVAYTRPQARLALCPLPAPKKRKPA